MRRLLLSALFVFACERGAPPPPAAPTPPPSAPTKAPPVTATATKAQPASELQIGKALSLNPHPAAKESPKSEPAAAPAPAEPEKMDPYVAAMVRAIEARKKNDPRAAEVEYRAALKAQPRDANALAGVAEMLFAQDKADQAIQPAELAYELKPTDPEVRWVFGLVMLSKNKRTDDALAAWEAILKDTPDYGKQLGLVERIKVIKAYTKGPPHAPQTKKVPPRGPSSGPASQPAPRQ